MRTRFFKDRDGYESINKDKNSIEDYVRDWSGYLEEGDDIATSEWVVELGNIAIEETIRQSKKTIVWLNGDAGNYSIVRNRITTTGGRTKDWSFRVYARES